MGLSASQARFLQLTARKSNVEYHAQQINFQRTQLAEKLSSASAEYQEKSSNRKLVFSYNDAGRISVDLTYNNYKNYMNQQMEGVGVGQQKYFLVSSSGNKIVVSSEEERDKMIAENIDYKEVPLLDEKGEKVLDEAGNPKVTVQETRPFIEDDFIIVDGLNDVDNFQSAIKEGVYYFATRESGAERNDNGTLPFNTLSWETLGAGAITEEYDKTDDAAAEAEFKSKQDKIQSIDKKLELQLDKLESERSAIETEIESVSKVIKDNVESTFKTFS